MSATIFRIEDLGFVSFEQASIYVDACFLLAFLDENGDDEGELVEHVLNKMEQDNIKYLFISNHVYSEVVQHLFLGHFYNVFHLAYRKFNLKEILTDEEEQILGNPFVARKLMQLVTTSKLEQLHRGEAAYIRVKDIIKIYKEQYADRDSLNHYYETVLITFNSLFSYLSETFKIHVKHLVSDENTFYLSQEFMSELQLEVKDSLHLAVARQHCADFFATLDADFVHKFYTVDYLENTAILHISKRYV